MNQVDTVQNFTATEPTFLTTLPLNNGQQPRAFQGPLLGLLIAASLLAKASQIRLPYFPDYDDNPWTPLRPPPNYLPLLYPVPEGYVQKRLTTASPQIQPPPLNQQQIIHIHDSPPKNEEAEGEVYQDVNERNHQQIINTLKQGVEEDDATTTRFVFENDSSASSDIINIDFPQNNSAEFGEDMSATNTFYERQRFGGANNKRHRINKPASTTRRETHKRPGYQSYDEDYQETRNRNRKRPTKRRPTTPSYDDYDNPNRKKRRPPPKNKFPGNRRPINNPPNYYDSNEYGGDDYYDDYNYQNEFNIFARQGTTTTTEEETETSTTTETTKTTAHGTAETTTKISTHHPSNTTGGGYTYAPSHTGYGPSNGNENISITYGPPTGPKHETLGPLFDAWYNHYNKNSVFRRLQELLTPNNFYNHHYDVNYQDNF